MTFLKQGVGKSVARARRVLSHRAPNYLGSGLDGGGFAGLGDWFVLARARGDGGFKLLFPGRDCVEHGNRGTIITTTIKQNTNMKKRVMRGQGK